MKLLLIVLSALLFSSNLSAKDIKIELTEIKHSTNDRSVFLIPTVIHDGNNLHFVSDVPLANLQILIKDNIGKIISIQEIALLPKQPYSYDIGNLESGTYILELNNGKHKYQGYFEVK
ncbi:DUF3244 domain-containing protein [Bacteroides sp. KH569_7]|uniref:DUF3244 domain-containing protein n=2 Tax=Bacteroides muris (ex Fokt et al. 2023) TaxID=2937417 RepID=A0A9X2NZ64_9BACE|nr:DUF3244 domain-containing protein [Bacteroides muris (ex Fokt et al. 2023)]